MTILRVSFLLLAVVAVATTAQPTPAPTGSINLTAILEKGGQFTTFIRLLNTTQVGQQVENQVNNSNEGMTVFAPTDNAFQNLKPGTINGLTNQQQVQLILYHVLPKFYSFDSFQTASNPVRTQATGNDGKPFGLTVTYLGVNNVNVSTGVVTVQINNALRSTLPLAVYQVDKVLLPEELFGAKAPKSSPESAESPKSDSKKAKSPSEAADSGKNGAYGVKSIGLGGLVAIVLVTMGLLL